MSNATHPGVSIAYKPAKQGFLHPFAKYFLLICKIIDAGVIFFHESKRALICARYLSA
jgi:hypothetical protein